MECKEWSPWSYVQFRPLCTNELHAKTSNTGSQCFLCVNPVLVEVACGGTATYEAQEGPPPFFPVSWVLISDDCTGSGTPSPPVTLPIAGETATTDCDCG